MLQAVLKRFAELLHVRLQLGVFTTEDSVRYAFFYSFLEMTAMRPEDIVLEYPHPTIERAHIDMWVPGFSDGGLAAEFKYDRSIPSGTNTPRPQKAGKLLLDLYRLGRVQERAFRVFVYCTDSEMATYLKKSSNGLADLFDLPVRRMLRIDARYLEGRCPTLVNAVPEAPNVVITSILRCHLPRAHELRVYQVRGMDAWDANACWNAEDRTGRRMPIGASGSRSGCSTTAHENLP